jgi:hypothetical protein
VTVQLVPPPVGLPAAAHAGLFTLELRQGHHRHPDRYLAQFQVLLRLVGLLLLLIILGDREHHAGWASVTHHRQRVQAR